MSKSTLPLRCCSVNLFFVSSGFNCVYWPVAAHFAPMGTHYIGTKLSPQLIVHKHGGPFRLLAHYHPNEKTECVWIKNRGGSSMAGRTITPLSALCEFWSLRCYTVVVPFASSAATVTPTDCQAGLMCVPQSSGSPPFSPVSFCLHHCCCRK